MNRSGDKVQARVNVLILAVEIDGVEKRFRRGDIIDLPKTKIKQLGNSVSRYTPPAIEEDDEEDEGPEGLAALGIVAAQGPGGEPPGKKRR